MSNEQISTSNRSIVDQHIDKSSSEVELDPSLRTSIPTSSCEYEWLTKIGLNEVSEKVADFQQAKSVNINPPIAYSSAVIFDHTRINLPTDHCGESHVIVKMPKSMESTVPVPTDVNVKPPVLADVNVKLLVLADVKPPVPTDVKPEIPSLTETEIGENQEHFDQLQTQSQGLTSGKNHLINRPCFNQELHLHTDNAVELKGEKGLVHANVITINYQNVEPNSTDRPTSIASAYPTPTLEGQQDFWQMALEQDTKLIIDFTELDGRFVKEEHWYYPTKVGDTKHYQDVDVKLEKFVDYHDKKASLFVYQVTDKQTGESKEVRRYHETTWQEMKSLNPNAFIDLVENVASDKPDSLIVHCRAGLGRTMTFYAGLELYHMVKLSKVDESNMQSTIDNVVMSMRDQRYELAIPRAKQRESLVIATKYWLAAHNANA